MGKTSSQVKNRWNAEHYTRISAYINREDGEAFKLKCKAKDISQAEIIKKAVYDFLGDK